MVAPKKRKAGNRPKENHEDLVRYKTRKRKRDLPPPPRPLDFDEAAMLAKLERAQNVFPSESGRPSCPDHSRRTMNAERRRAPRQTCRRPAAALLAGSLAATRVR